MAVNAVDSHVDPIRERLVKKAENNAAAVATVPIVSEDAKKQDALMGLDIQQSVSKQQERTLDDKKNFNARVEELQKEIEAEGKKFETGKVTIYTDKKEYKEAKKQYKKDVEAKKQEYIKQGYDKKIAEQKAKAEIPEVRHKSSKDLAKGIVENERNQQKFETTNVYLNKEDYEKAEAQKEQKRDELAAKYAADGMDKKEAKKKAERELPLNTYVKDNKTKKFVDTHKDVFYDEKGKFNSDKFKQVALGFANLNTGENEETNYHLSLKERRQGAALYNANPDKKIEIKNDVVSDIAKNSNLGWERDHTRAIRAAVIGGGAVVGAAAGWGLSTAISTASAAATTAGATAAAGGSIANSGAAASAAASVTVKGLEAVGAAVGAGVGAAGAGFLADQGGNEDVIPKLKHSKKPEETPNPNPTPDPDPIVNPNPEPVKCILEPVNVPVASTIEEEQTCLYKLQKGQSLYDAVRDGYGLKDHKEIMKYVHEIKDRYGIKYSDYTARTEWEMPEINGRKFKCDVDVNGTVKEYADKNKKGVLGEFTRRRETIENDPLYYTKDCNNNLVQYKTKEERDKAVADSEL